MLSNRRRVLELALESLENKKRQLDAEIAEITRELSGRSSKGMSVSALSESVHIFQKKKDCEDPKG